MQTGLSCKHLQDEPGSNIHTYVLVDRHQMGRANYAQIKRFGQSEWVQNAGQYWNLFAERACDIATAMETHPGFKRSELILGKSSCVRLCS